MFWGIILLVMTIIHFRDTIRKSNRPEKLKEDFMWENGYTNSLVALRYFFGRPQEGRAAIENDITIRRKYITERLIIDAFGFCLGLLIILRPLCLMLWNANP
jgi:hypothetical protein